MLSPNLRANDRAFLILVAIAFFFFSANPSAAQCASVGYGPIALGSVSANPLQAVVTTTRTPPPDPDRPVPLLLAKPQITARDSEGRVRIDRIYGEFHLENGPDAGADVEAHTVNICDPTLQEVIQLTNVNHTATIHHLDFLRSGHFPRSNSTGTPFCRIPGVPKNSADMVVEELGHRTIEGFDALGWRVITHTQMPNSTPSAKLQRIREVWCSEELNAILLQVLSGSENGPRDEIALTQIQRTEPDPSLFQIPSDYTVTESVPQSPALQSQVPPARPASQIPPPLH